MVLILLPLFCKHDNLILKLHRNKIATNLNLYNQMKNCLPRKISKLITLCILKKEDR